MLTRLVVQTRWYFRSLYPQANKIKTRDASYFLVGPIYTLSLPHSHPLT